MKPFLASLVVFVTFLGFAACGDEDLQFGEPSDNTPTPDGDDTATPDDTTTPTSTPTATPTP
jgi:hypothetical protein